MSKQQLPPVGKPAPAALLSVAAAVAGLAEEDEIRQTIAYVWRSVTGKVPCCRVIVNHGFARCRRRLLRVMRAVKMMLRFMWHLSELSVAGK